MSGPVAAVLGVTVGQPQRALDGKAHKVASPAVQAGPFSPASPSFWADAAAFRCVFLRLNGATLPRTQAKVGPAAGLRVGGLPGLSIKGGRYSTTSKGKEIAGDLDPAALSAIVAAYAARLGVPVLTLGAAEVDDWISNFDLAPSTVNVRVAVPLAHTPITR